MNITQTITELHQRHGRLSPKLIEEIEVMLKRRTGIKLSALFIPLSPGQVAATLTIDRKEPPVVLFLIAIPGTSTRAKRLLNQVKRLPPDLIGHMFSTMGFICDSQNLRSKQKVMAADFCGDSLLDYDGSIDEQIPYQQEAPGGGSVAVFLCITASGKTFLFMCEAAESRS